MVDGCLLPLLESVQDTECWTEGCSPRFHCLFLETYTLYNGKKLLLQICNCNRTVSVLPARV